MSPAPRLAAPFASASRCVASVSVASRSPPARRHRPPRRCRRARTTYWAAGRAASGRSRRQHETLRWPAGGARFRPPPTAAPGYSRADTDDRRSRRSRRGRRGRRSRRGRRGRRQGRGIATGRAAPSGRVPRCRCTGAALTLQPTPPRRRRPIRSDPWHGGGCWRSGLGT